MNAPILRVFVLTVAASLVVCVLCFLAPRSDGVAQSFRTLMESDRRDEELDQMWYYTHRHRESTKQLVREVIAQRCSLREAVERLRELYREWLEGVERQWPNDSRDLARHIRKEWSTPDWHYQWIATTVQTLLFDRPEEAAVVLRRLEQEYQQLQGRSSTCQEP